MEAFLTLAQSAKDKAAVQLIQDCLNSNVYQFDKLLHHPNILALKQSHPDHYRLLEIFTTGTLQDYTSNLPPLNEKQLLKLKQLTLISQASKKQVFYADLLKLLDIQEIRELEDLIIQTIEQGLIQGKLDQKKACVYMESAIGRMNIDILSVLSNWYNNTAVVLQSINDQIATCELELKQEAEKKQQVALKTSGSFTEKK